MAILGPGLIAACADNDAGGISTYSIAGAYYGYSLLWVLFVITLSLAFTQEIGARTGAVTGKGLAGLIREEFGLRATAFAMLTLLIANLGTTVSEFAGMAASLELFGVSKYIAVPTLAIIVWLLVTRGSYKGVERIFLGFSILYVTYIISGIMVKPPWGEVIRQTFVPSFRLEGGYLLAFIALVGTTITPWGQFFIQSYVVDKGLGIREYKYTRLEVFLGAFITDLVSFFILVCTAATLYVRGIGVQTAADAALALEPLAGRFAEGLFALGLLNASLLGAAILPLATAYAICEAFGWEAGVSRSFREAPLFNGLFTFTLGFGAAVALVPGLPLMWVMLVAQDVNGILLPVILFYALRIASNKRIMGRYANGPVFNLIAWGTAIGLIILTVLLLFSPLLSPFLPA
ncbi:MAG: Nramp family divalent metal transporter [Chloroflexi bacterium]|nr:Nramp family divalent metal transporter [Chloroflexota bacterium]MCL5075243.1 Nramp family divalent metal transporter [Chloroflexota bacterium]